MQEQMRPDRNVSAHNATRRQMKSRPPDRTAGGGIDIKRADAAYVAENAPARVV